MLQQRVEHNEAFSQSNRIETGLYACLVRQQRLLQLRSLKWGWVRCQNSVLILLMRTAFWTLNSVLKYSTLTVYNTHFVTGYSTHFATGYSTHYCMDGLRVLCFVNPPHSQDRVCKKMSTTCWQRPITIFGCCVWCIRLLCGGLHDLKVDRLL